MGPISQIEQILRNIESVLLVLLLIRLSTTRLVGLYRAFAVYLLIWLFQDTIPLLLHYNIGGDRYAELFFISEPLAWIACCAVLLELFSLTFTDFPGIRSAGRLFVTAGIVVAVAIALATAIPSILTLPNSDRLLEIYFIAERSVMLIVLILLAALVFLMVHYRLHLPRNTVVYEVLYAIYFSIRAVQTVLINSSGSDAGSTVNVIGMVVDVACLIFWMVLLTREGAKSRMVAGPKLSDKESDRLRAQLYTVNQFVGKLSVH